MAKVKVMETWIGACAGCEISVLDTHEALLPILEKVEFVYIPVLMDVKHVPKATVGIVSGCVRNSDNLHELLEMRKNSDILVALGSCACFGGTPGMANLYTNEQILEEVYVTTKSTKNEIQRHPYMDGLPTLLPEARPCSDYVKIDAMIPGCGPNPAMIAQALYALLGVGEYKLSTKSVCDECSREKSERNLKKILRPWEGDRGREEVPVRAGLHLQRFRHESGLRCKMPVGWRSMPWLLRPVRECLRAGLCNDQRRGLGLWPGRRPEHRPGQVRS